MKVERVTAASQDWRALRASFWPDAQDHDADMAAALAHGAAFLARNDAGAAVGFAEGAIRTDYVNGAATSPVAFLEGIFVRPEFRGHGAAQLLAGAIEDWARGAGMSELASDAALNNAAAQAMHRALGFTETERVVFYTKPLGGP
jgi:aminoglycoside 6'-N-acetyltransferase I